MKKHTLVPAATRIQGFARIIFAKRYLCTHAAYTNHIIWTSAIHRRTSRDKYTVLYCRHALHNMSSQTGCVIGFYFPSDLRTACASTPIGELRAWIIHAKLYREAMFCALIGCHSLTICTSAVITRHARKFPGQPTSLAAIDTSARNQRHFNKIWVVHFKSDGVFLWV